MKYAIGFAFVMLALVGGAWAWQHFFAKPRIITKTEWMTRPVVIASKTETKRGTTLPFNSETARRDTIFSQAPCDSVRKLAHTISLPFFSVFSDSISASDSLGSFFAMNVDTISVDPFTRLITRARSFHDAMLRISHTSTTEIRTEIDWLASAAAFGLGLLLALLLAR